MVCLLKERICELSKALIERQVLIMLANSDTKEFLYRWQLLHEDAARKLQSLDAAISDAQDWERRLRDLGDWAAYMDQYLAARLHQDIFAGDVPDDFARIGLEFARHEALLAELDAAAAKHGRHGERLAQQRAQVAKAWADLAHKFNKFQKPADFDQRLHKVRKTLDEIEQV